MVVTAGVDSSTTNCGIVIYHDGVFKESILLRFKGKYSPKKLRTIIEDVGWVFARTKPNIVLIEEPAPIRFSRAVTSLNQVAGAIFSLGTRHNAFVDFVHNKTAKSLMDTKTKEDSIDLAYRITGERMSEHEADALLIVEAYKKIIDEI